MTGLEFEQALSSRPQVAAEGHGREPCLRDLVLRYYEAHFDAVRSDALTKEYIFSLSKMLRIDVNQSTHQ